MAPAFSASVDLILSTPEKIALLLLKDEGQTSLIASDYHGNSIKVLASSILPGDYYFQAIQSADSREKKTGNYVASFGQEQKHL